MKFVITALLFLLTLAIPFCLLFWILEQLKAGPVQFALLWGSLFVAIAVSFVEWRCIK